MLGPLLECLSLYMMYSKVNDQGIDFIAGSQQNIQIVINIAKYSIYPPTPKNSPLNDEIEYACDGALLLQLIFQNLNGSPLLDQHVKTILEIVLQRLSEQNKNLTRTLKRQLILVILSSMLQNTNATLEALSLCTLLGKNWLKEICQSLID